MNLFSRIFGRSIENPSTPLSDPDSWMIDTWGGAADSGVNVTQASALTYSPVWRAVTAIAWDAGKLPLVLYQRDGGGKKKAIGHPAYLLMRRKPAPHLTDFAFKSAMMASALMLGNAYAQIVRKGDRSPVALRIMASERVEVVHVDGQMMYRETRANGSFAGNHFASDVLHIRGLSLDGQSGISVIQKARDSFGIGMAAQKYGALWFKNSGLPPITLSTASRLTKETASRVSKSWRAAYGGDRQHSVAVLEDGLTANVLSIKHQEAQLMELREHEVRQTANWFSVPPHKLGDTTRGSYASLEQENQSYLDQALDPWLYNWEAECWDKLLDETQKKKDSHFFEFSRQALIRSNLTDRVAAYNTAIMGGWMSRDEARARENMNPIPGGEGSRFFVPLNMSLTGEDVGEADQTEEKKVPVVSVSELAGLIIDAAQRAVKRMGGEASRAARKPDSFCDWIDEISTEKNRSIFDECVGPILRVVPSAPTLDDIRGRFFAEMSASFLDSTNVTPDRLTDSVREARSCLETTLPPLVADLILNGAFNDDDHKTTN